jgi:hypothetical protein
MGLCGSASPDGSTPNAPSNFHAFSMFSNVRSDASESISPALVIPATSYGKSAWFPRRRPASLLSAGKRSNKRHSTTALHGGLDQHNVVMQMTEREKVPPAFRHWANRQAWPKDNHEMGEESNKVVKVRILGESFILPDSARSRANSTTPCRHDTEGATVHCFLRRGCCKDIGHHFKGSTVENWSCGY